MTSKLPAFLCLVLIMCQNQSQGQQDSSGRRHSIAVFAPLYLDSAFDGTGTYRYDKTFPRFINPGLEFYEGIKLAADSLAVEETPVTIDVFDTRSSTRTLTQQINSPEVQQAGLIIGHVTPSEERLLASAALKLHIPFINANLPNDAGISNNPSLVILNSTLQTHCESIYHFLQRNYGTAPVIVFRKKGIMEDRLQSYFTDAEKNTAGVPLHIRFVTWDEAKPNSLLRYLDSSRMTIAIAGSLDENFGKDLAKQLSATFSRYPALLVGMPTWDVITGFSKLEYAGLPVIYSTPFYSTRTDKVSMEITAYFKNTLFARPSDMVFRGYECLYRFGKLLSEKGSNLYSSIGEKKYPVFTDWDIEPVLDKQTMSINYFENKKLYFVKKINGEVVQVY